MMIDSKFFENVVAFTITKRCWGNQRKADKEKIQTDTDKKRLGLTKKLIEADEYDAIKTLMGEIGNWLEARSVPSFFKKGIYFFKLDMVEQVDAYLKSKQPELAELVEKFCEVYPNKVSEARLALNGQFKIEDYPAVEDLRDRFGYDWCWVNFGVPDSLPDEIKRQEMEKAQARWEEVSQEMLNSVRLLFKGLIDHAVERLTTKPGEKPKGFHATLVTNIKDFIATFDAKNLMNDFELEGLVRQANDLLRSVDADDLKTNTNLKDYTIRNLGGIKEVLDTMIIEKPKRRFAFDEV